MDNHGTFTGSLTPLSLLAEMSASQANGSLQVLSGGVAWYIYFEHGQITYATHSIEPLERLERNLRRLGYKITETLKESYAQVGQNYKNNPEELNKNLDYILLCHLVNQKLLDAFNASELVDELVKEVLELYSWIPAGNYNFSNHRSELPKLAKINTDPIIKYCQNRLKAWQGVGSGIWSPYQRPYFFGKNNNTLTDAQNPHKLNNILEQRLGSLLKGFSFRQLGVLLNQDELKLAQSLQPYIQEGTILLREPQPPYDKLPKILPSIVAQPGAGPTINTNTGNNIAASGQANATQTPAQKSDKTTKYTVVCVDDSPTILNEIARFLDEKTFMVYKISDPLKALMQILRIKPDIILLDVGMPNMDGYELCRLLRNNSLFKNIPIIMVTGNTGIIDRGRARLVGASGYLTKPFTQSELVKMVFKHLN